MNDSGLTWRKIFSGRYFSTVSVVLTYCICMIMTLYLALKGKAEWAIFTNIFTPFALLAKDVVLGYFERTDRKGEKNAEDPIKSGS